MSPDPAHNRSSPDPNPDDARPLHEYFHRSGTLGRVSSPAPDSPGPVVPSTELSQDLALGQPRSSSPIIGRSPSLDPPPPPYSTDLDVFERLVMPDPDSPERVFEDIDPQAPGDDAFRADFVWQPRE